MLNHNQFDQAKLFPNFHKEKLTAHKCYSDINQKYYLTNIFNKIIYVLKNRTQNSEIILNLYCMFSFLVFKLMKCIYLILVVLAFCILCDIRCRPIKNLDSSHFLIHQLWKSGCQLWWLLLQSAFVYMPYQGFLLMSGTIHVHGKPSSQLNWLILLH